MGPKSSPFQKSGIYCWIDGEIYNRDNILNYFDYDSKSFSELLIDAYSNNNLELVLSKIDGYFNAVLYTKSNLYLISDRYGMKPLYIWNNGNNFAWASELKAFLAFNSFKPTINENAITCFLNLGHLLGQITWFKNVNMIKAATIVKYSIKKKKIINEKRYWKWSSIETQNIKFNEAVVKLGQLLKSAIKKRVKSDEKLGVSLSGGLDSRLILSILDQIDDLDVVYFTYGIKGCDDINIAKTVSSIKENTHYIFEINKKNWLNEKFHQIWYSDGMVSFLHIHNPISLERLRELFNIHLNGFAGDLIMGGSWIHNIDEKISKPVAIEKFGAQIIFTNLNDDFFKISHEDPYFIDTRVRRFTNIAQIAYSRLVETRKPFLDNKLIEFLYSISDKYRINSKLYKNTLLSEFPKYFKKIPWQKTELPILRNKPFYIKIFKIIKKLLAKFSIIKSSKNYTNYDNWLRHPKLVKLALKILNPKNAIYSKYINVDFINQYLIPHIRKNNIFYRLLSMAKVILYSIKEYFVLKLCNKSHRSFMDILKNFDNSTKYTYDYSKKLGSILTMEIWFQQIFNKRYRS